MTRIIAHKKENRKNKNKIAQEVWFMGQSHGVFPPRAQSKSLWGAGVLCFVCSLWMSTVSVWCLFLAGWKGHRTGGFTMYYNVLPRLLRGKKLNKTDEVVGNRVPKKFLLLCPRLALRCGVWPSEGVSCEGLVCLLCLFCQVACPVRDTQQAKAQKANKTNKLTLLLHQ